MHRSSRVRSPGDSDSAARAKDDDAAAAAPRPMPAAPGSGAGGGGGGGGGGCARRWRRFLRPVRCSFSSRAASWAWGVVEKGPVEECSVAVEACSRWEGREEK